jgi:hypothetical protein
MLAAGVIVLAAAMPALRAVAQSTSITDDNLAQMTESAKTAADHQALAAYYQQEAALAKKKAALHRNTADTYKKLKIAKPVGMVRMCKNVAAYWDQVASADEKLAEAQTQLAQQPGGQ